MTGYFYYDKLSAIMKLDTKKIRERIKTKGMTIEQAAEKMGFSRQNLQMILKNESTLLGRLDNIADALDMDPRDLLI